MWPEATLDDFKQPTKKGMFPGFTALFELVVDKEAAHCYVIVILAAQMVPLYSTGVGTGTEWRLSTSFGTKDGNVKCQSIVFLC